MNVVYALTHHVYEWILPSLRSLAATNPGTRVFILCEDDEFPYELPIKAEIINVTGQKWFPADKCVNYNTSFKYINLLKVRYPTILPVDKVIHLDIDTIICDSLKEMWSTDLTGKWVGACLERNGTYRPFGDRYWNMGVALINLKQMRKDKIEQKMQDYLNGIRQPYADQDAWNRYGTEQDKFVTLDTRWNESVVTGRTAHPGIIHYCGMKDWYTRFDMPRVEYLNEYRREDAR